MKKRVCLFLLSLCLITPNVYALSENVEGSWATYNEGNLDSSLVDKGYESRTNLEYSLFSIQSNKR